MRIISGKYKGKQLLYPKDNEKLRPTKDMVKEAVFSIIYEKINGASFLDLFAGVGSIGFEALSRGAAQVVFVDLQPQYIFKNAEKLNCLQDIFILKKDYLTALEILAGKNLKYDLIYIDPPYESDLATVSLNNLNRFDILSPQAMIFVETAKSKVITTNFKLIKERIYGNTKITILEK